MPRRRTLTTRASIRHKMSDALRKVKTGALALDVLRVFVEHLVRAGFSRDDIIAYVGEHVDQWIDDACSKSQVRLIRRCGDNIGDMAETVTKHKLNEHLPQ